ncbi:MAG: transposase [Boseongicola sp. SB0670_bin_30]|nr:transposase [Boseongicola sp. SB0670_bin_30]
MVNMGRRQIRGCKCRPCPNGAQEAALSDMRGHFRDLCYADLRQRAEARNRQGVGLGHDAQTGELRAVRDAVPELAGHSSNAERQVLQRLFHGLASRHRVIAMEDLNMEALKRSFLARSVRDAARTQLRNMLGFKAESAGGSVFLVAPRGASRRCSGCGRDPDRPKTVADRVYGRDGFGLVPDRDVNAARNVLQLVQRPGTGIRPRSVRVAA